MEIRKSCKNIGRSRRPRTLKSLWVTTTVSAGVITTLLLSSNRAISAPDPEAPPTASTKPKVWEEWRRSMARTPKPKKGCYEAAYPNTEWQEVQCTTAPQRPYLPARGSRPYTVGNVTDLSAHVLGSISLAEGSFERVTDVTSESGGGVANAFSLQLNTNFFTTSSCNNIPGCEGWEQFLFANSTTASAFIQYWLLNYGSTCPAGWIQNNGSCYKNSVNAVSVPIQTIATLGNLSLTGNASSGGTDEVILSIGSNLYSVAGNNSVAGLATEWQAAEFNVFGDGGLSQAVFNTGSTIVVRTSVDSGTTIAPTCENTGTTGETNNLTLVTTPKPCCPIGGASPAIVFTESNAAGAKSTCAQQWLSPIIDFLLNR